MNTGCTVAPTVQGGQIGSSVTNPVAGGIDMMGNVTGNMAMEGTETDSIFYCPGTGFNAGDPIQFGPSGPQLINGNVVPGSDTDGLGNSPWRVRSGNSGSYSGTGLVIDIWYGINCAPSVERVNPASAAGVITGQFVCPTRRWPSDTNPPGSATPDLYMPKNSDCQFNTSVPFIFDGLYMNFFDVTAKRWRPFPRHNKNTKINIPFHGLSRRNA